MDTALLTAVENSDLASLENLLKTQASIGDVINQRNEEDETLLHKAATHDDAKLVHLLLQRGADPNVRDMNGWTPLTVAAKSGSLCVVDELLQAGADPRTMNDDRTIALHYLSAHSFADVALFNMIFRKLHLDDPELFNAQNRGLDTPLHYAVFGKAFLPVIRNLLDCPGIDVNLANKRKLTPLHVAIMIESEEVASLLLEHGAKVTDEMRKTASRNDRILALLDRQQDEFEGLSDEETPEKAQALISANLESHSNRLDLTNTGLSSTPKSLLSCVHVRRLNLSRNHIAMIPRSLCFSLRNLSSLSLFSNKLSSLPQNIGSLSSLTVLDVANNQLTKLPASLFKVKGLLILNVSNNKLRRIDSALSSLVSLEELVLSGNPTLVSLPASIKDLRSLTTLDVRQCSLSMLPRGLRNIGTLREVRVQDNATLVYPPLSVCAEGLHPLLAYLAENEPPTTPPTPSFLASTKMRLSSTDLLMHGSSSEDVTKDIIDAKTSPNAVRRARSPSTAASRAAQMVRHCKGWLPWTRVTNDPFSAENLTLLDNHNYADYADYFYEQPHVLFFGKTDVDDEPVVIAIQNVPVNERYRVLLRTVETDTRVFLPLDTDEDVMKLFKKKGSRLGVSAKTKTARTSKLLEKLGELHPMELDVRQLDVALVSEQYLQCENRLVVGCHKFGILHCEDGGLNDDEMFSSVGSQDFETFVTSLGDKVTLDGFTEYAGGLDVKSGSTGSHSIYTNYEKLEIMFHVSCYLPLQEHDTQRVERKRHLGNDIVVVVFLEKDANVGFSPLSIKSHFIHTYVVVQVDHCEGEDIYYRVCVVSDETVREVAPFPDRSRVFKRGPELRCFILSTLVNYERAAMQAPAFSKPMRRTRKVLLDQFSSEVGKQGGGFVKRALRHSSLKGALRPRSHRGRIKLSNLRTLHSIEDVSASSSSPANVGTAALSGSAPNTPKAGRSHSSGTADSDTEESSDPVTQKAPKSARSHSEVNREKRQKPRSRSFGSAATSVLTFRGDKKDDKHKDKEKNKHKRRSQMSSSTGATCSAAGSVPARPPEMSPEEVLAQELDDAEREAFNAGRKSQAVGFLATLGHSGVDLYLQVKPKDK